MNKLTVPAQNEERGMAAVQALTKEGLSPKFHHLDITDSASIQRLRGFLTEKHGGFMCLINNVTIIK
jgi:NAD(P)-dependent dehydrogenase (short-subunit alcohol dehydrogenase family)